MKNVLVVGGSSGIGQAISVLLASDSTNVYATFNSTPIKPKPGIIPIPLNVMEKEFDLDVLPDSLDGLVYCPGSIQLRPFSRLKPESFVEDFELQVLGGIKILQEVLPKLKAANQASVIFFSTVAVQKGFQFHAQVAASKGAIEGLTRSLAAEFAPAIRVNAIAPSITDTPLAEKLLRTEEKKEANARRHPLQKIGSPKNIADAALFLLSDKSSWITGQVMQVDGGLSSINL